MKTFWFLLLSVWAGAGCLEISFTTPKTETIPPSPLPVGKTNQPPMTADQLNEKNASQKVDEVNQELDREELKDASALEKTDPRKK